MLCKKKKKKKTEKGRCYGAQCIMGRTIKIAVVFTQHGVGLVRSASGGLTDDTQMKIWTLLPRLYYTTSPIVVSEE